MATMMSGTTDTVEDYKPWYDELWGKSAGIGSAMGRGATRAIKAGALPAGAIATLLASLLGSEIAPTKAQKEAMQKSLYELAKSGDTKARALWEKQVNEARAAIEKAFTEAGGSANLGRAFVNDYASTAIDTATKTSFPALLNPTAGALGGAIASSGAGTVAGSMTSSYNPARPFLPSAGALGGAIASSGAGTVAGSMTSSYNPARPFLPVAGSIVDPLQGTQGATNVIDPTQTSIGNSVVDPATQAIGTSVIDPTRPFLPISGIIDPAQEIVGSNVIVDPIQGTIEDVTTGVDEGVGEGVAEGVAEGVDEGVGEKEKDITIPWLPIPGIEEITGDETGDDVITIDTSWTPDPPPRVPEPDPIPIWGDDDDDEDDEDGNNNGEYNMANIDWLKWLEDNQAKQWAREDMIRKETQEREDSAYQRAIKDMYKAGINPNLMNVQPASAGGGITNATGINTGILEAQISNDTKLLEQMLEQAFKGDENTKDRFTDVLGSLIQSIVTAMIFKG